MFLSELKVHAAVLSDEDPDIQTVVRYANSCIAHVNRVAKTKFPFFNLEAFDPEQELPFINDTWNYALFIPFIVAEIKKQEASPQEYSLNMSTFEQALKDFTVSSDIPADMRNGEGSVIEIDHSQNIWANRGYKWGGPLDG
ncbi:hypothetical protein [Bacillus thuringiensis]|uniref:hypothetical protein n=1 Tax=Bacillus thuringiensis TaxID=1428 RepID=UPI000BF89166|nr:hypothetical protein [Bacillus thuringiensis]PFD30368.1 hypothetical protein CN278_25725 [Bacillus thuringiensis]